jgi:hypothetical protein
VDGRVADEGLFSPGKVEEDLVEGAADQLGALAGFVARQVIGRVDGSTLRDRPSAGTYWLPARFTGMRAARSYLSGLALAFSLAACAGVAPAVASGTLTGLVYAGGCPGTVPRDQPARACVRDPVPGATVGFQPLGGGELRQVKAGSDGHYRVVLPAGRYRVVLSGPSFRGQVRPAEVGVVAGREARVDLGTMFYAA